MVGLGVNALEASARDGRVMTQQKGMMVGGIRKELSRLAKSGYFMVIHFVSA
jgi:hypothetical protein